MMTTKTRARWGYAIAFMVIFAVEVVIALFVRDAFIRPYGGDILVTALLCCAVRMVFPDGIRWLPAGVLLFAIAVEAAQYFRFVEWIGLGDIAFFRILMGTSFSWIDILCYAAGCALFWAVDTAIRRKKA